MRSRDSPSCWGLPGGAGETSALLQDLRYAYDPVGNVVSLLDQAQPTQWHSNTQIDASSHYAYDSLYQLIQATGRESAVASIGPGLPAQVSFGATDSGCTSSVFPVATSSLYRTMPSST